MIQSRAKTTTLIRWQSRKESSRETSLWEATPYIVILGLLCALSTVSAIQDPLGFFAIFGGL